MKEIIGWGSALIGLPTFGMQVHKQWQNRHEQVPTLMIWFFVLALIGGAGQLVYSWMNENWVFVMVNVCLIITNSVGLALVIYRQKTCGRHPNRTSACD